MPSPSKSISTLSSTHVAILGVGGVACLLAAWWALRPLPTPAIDASTAAAAGAQTTSSANSRPPLQPSAFAVQLWTPSTDSASGALANGPHGEGRKSNASGPATTATSPTLHLQLIGILRDDSLGSQPGHATLRAALYNAETDTLHIVASGERVGPHLVQAIEPAFVTIAAATGNTTTLTLEPGSFASPTTPSSTARPDTPRHP